MILLNPYSFAPASGGLSSDTSLSVFTINGITANDEGTVNLPNGTTSVTVVAMPTHVAASVGTITGDSGLVTGDNTLEFDVTAEDGGTVQHYNVTLHVLTAAVAELTRVSHTADSNGSLHGKKFALNDANGSVGVYFDNGARKEITKLEFPSGDPSLYITGGAGLAVVISDATERYGYWINTGTETQPDLSAYGVTTYIEVLLDTGSQTPFQAFESGIIAGGFGNFNNPGGSSSPTLLMVEDKTNGPRTAAVNAGSNADVSVTQTGRDAATAPGGYDRTVVVNIGDNMDQHDVGIAIYTAFLSDAGFVAATGPGGSSWSEVDFTDNATGERTDAVDVDAGFSISVVQQGAIGA